MKLIFLESIPYFGQDRYLANEPETCPTSSVSVLFVDRYSFFTKEPNSLINLHFMFAKKIEIFKPLKDNGFTLLACPGNHDYGRAGNFYTEKSQQYFQDYILVDLIGNQEAQEEGIEMEQLYPMQQTIGNVLFLGIDSVVGYRDITIDPKFTTSNNKLIEK